MFSGTSFSVQDRRIDVEDLVNGEKRRQEEEPPDPVLNPSIQRNSSPYSKILLCLRRSMGQLESAGASSTVPFTSCASFTSPDHSEVVLLPTPLDLKPQVNVSLHHAAVPFSLCLPGH